MIKQPETPEVATIASGWAAIDQSAASADVPKAQREHFRLIYYAGVGRLWEILVSDGPPTQQQLRDLHAELVAFEDAAVEREMEMERRGRERH